MTFTSISICSQSQPFVLKSLLHKYPSMIHILPSIQMNHQFVSNCSSDSKCSSLLILS